MRAIQAVMDTELHLVWAAVRVKGCTMFAHE